MALRSLLRLVSTAGPRMGPGISPAAAPLFTKTGVSPTTAARFMKTGSQGEAKTVAEQESIRISKQHLIDAYDKNFAKLEEAAGQRLGELLGVVDSFKKVAISTGYVAAAIPWIFLIGKDYRRSGTLSSPWATKA